MKKYIYFLLAFGAMIACNERELTDASDRPHTEEGKFYTVSLGMKSVDGELHVQQQPLSKAGETSNDLWWIQITAVTENGDEFPWAYGVFDRTDSMNVKLAEAYTYTIEASYIKNGADKLAQIDGFWLHPISEKYNIEYRDYVTGEFVTPYYYSGDSITTTNRFIITKYKTVSPNEISILQETQDSVWLFYDEIPDIDRYYGGIINYKPVENGKISLNMYRMRMGYRITVQPFSTGSLVVNFLDRRDTIPASSTVTSWGREMQFPYNWEGIRFYGFENSPGYGQEYFREICGGPYLYVYWISPDGKEIIPVYSDYIYMYRLQRTLIDINVKITDAAHENGVETTIESKSLTDSDTTRIEGTVDLSGGVDTELNPNE